MMQVFHYRDAHQGLPIEGCGTETGARNIQNLGPLAPLMAAAAAAAAGGGLGQVRGGIGLHQGRHVGVAVVELSAKHCLKL